ncbi:M20/M25/M40 family metallo-hydrolase [Sphingomonas carotinifaciens]|uniref:Acetylornithine deacetylase/Succinyl-diaminopimelate desuccinylase n=1 Tax=Sphingomonas carotinifaciens TaxID=1166323 RepID=A0A1G7GR10_9SPHN|nr:M20/M25/M40 family metallo-hydrolase [Sphingomonas carotinifaciens]MBB4086632.1 acetylornithine deacetylase/succinyl-diaminopimelate desuccinylase-like protein [Sphingomonas carotinifaciens]MWC42981.1 M20/M25/M40 family metallo-hydrolase [Sphingomonas carotinifaciens]SDE90521.1 Acetylornithine deacetylase/Succinyl-diaminopimelate desuccinylase [Sphingomonas carotinifaciens]
MHRWRALAAAAICALSASAAAAQNRPDQRAFLRLYKELVETDTTPSAGSCTRAAGQIAARLRAAGFPGDAVVTFAPPDHPREGGVVAVLPGSDPALPAVLLLGHLDVVEARRADWTRDPFTLVEEDGYFYGRGTFDDKAQGAVWADTMIRLRPLTPRRTVKLALTCGEETTFAFNGAEWLTRTRPDLIAAGFVLNEGGGGRYGANGRPDMLAVQIGEKAAQNYTLTATHNGGHSAQPTGDNAIYALVGAVQAIREHRFPVSFTATTRAFFAAMAQRAGAEMGEAIRRLLADAGDAEADAIVSRDKTLQAALRTTCVPTLLSAGHAENALPQRATANINCRLFPGETVEGVLDTLRGLAGPEVVVTANQPIRPTAVPLAPDPAILAPMTQVAKRHFPGVPVVPMMSAGATDGIFFQAIGIPVYGVPGMLIDGDMSGIHGRDERIRVKALYAGRDYLFDLVKAYAGVR